MNHKTENSIVKMILLALIFIIIAGAIYLTAGKSIRMLVAVKVKMAVDLGAPIYRYTGEDAQPKEGKLKKSEAVIPSIGSRYGTIVCERIKLKTPLYYGDSEALLEQGAGQYTGSGLPGEGKPILVGAHDIGYFAPLEEITQGDLISVNTSYGAFQYKVTDIVIKMASAVRQKDLEHPNEELILYTCYPFGVWDGEKAKRYFVAAEKISGPVFVEDINEKQQ